MMTVEGKSFSVVGLARTGVAAANYLAQRGADVLVTDAGTPDAKVLASVHPAVKVEVNGNRVRPGDVVIMSPGLKPGNPVVRMAHERGSETLSDIELFGRLCPCPIVAITGTDGKSTTTTLVGKLLEAAGRTVFVGGNIGVACMEGLERLDANSVAVLEVSCFQLVHCFGFRPRSAVVTNIAEDHVEYHGSMKAYIEAKQRIYQAMLPGDRLVLNGDDPEIRTWKLPAGLDVRRFGWTRESDAWCDSSAIYLGDRLIELSDVALPGKHNVENIMAAVLAVEGVFVPRRTAVDVLKVFRGLEHRMEYVDTVDGVAYFNDSKATNPHAAMAVLNAFDEPFILLAGGYEKGSDFTEMGQLIAKKTRSVILYGATRDRIRQSIPESHPVRMTETLQQAVEAARTMARPGERVILAPACASYDQFNDFEHRGRVFKDLVRKLPRSNA
jgi:UDP-N-acetylmuramoylalanine--D-glutamate ligase